MAETPTSRTLDECRKRGYVPGVVERWKPGYRKSATTGEPEQIPYGTRVDFLGFADIFALDGQPGYLAIQACAGGDLSKRLQKALAVPELTQHLEAGNRFQVWAWRQVWITGKTGKTKRQQWKPKVVTVVLRDGMLFHEEGEILTQGGDAPRLRTPESTTLSNPAQSDTDPAGPQPDLFAKEE